MSLSAKRRALFTLLTVLTLWPAVHHVAAVRWDLHPWRFFGLSMYAAPRPVVFTPPYRIRIGRSEGPWFEPATLPDPQQEKLREVMVEFTRRRTFYGTLLKTEDLAERLFELYPLALRVKVEFELLRLKDDRYVRRDIEALEFER